MSTHGPMLLRPQPGDIAEELGPPPTHKLRKLLPYFRPYAGKAVLTIVLMLVVTAAGLAAPALTQIAIDRGIDQRDKAVLTLAVVAFIVAGLVGWAAGYGQTYLSSWVGERVLLDLRTKLFRHLMGLELGYHERTPTGRSVSRLTSDIEALNQLVTDGITSLVINGLTFIGVVVILFIYDWKLAFVAFAIFPVLALGTAAFRVASAKAYRLTRERVANVLSTLQETLSGMRVVQGYGRQEPTRQLFRDANDAYREANMATVRLSGVYFPGIELLSGSVQGTLREFPKQINADVKFLARVCNDFERIEIAHAPREVEMLDRGKFQVVKDREVVLDLAPCHPGFARDKRHAGCRPALIGKAADCRIKDIPLGHVRLCIKLGPCDGACCAVHFFSQHFRSRRAAFTISIFD